MFENVGLMSICMFFTSLTYFEIALTLPPFLLFFKVSNLAETMVWPIPFPINMFTALKGSQRNFLFQNTAKTWIKHGTVDR